jgi:AbiV family abortive infection protein
MNAAIRNAGELAREARLLLEAGSFPRAASLAILSIEESGKVTVLRELALARDDAERLEAWRAYRSHTSKNFMWLLPQLVAMGARRFRDFAELVAPGSDHPEVLDQVKQVGFYTDCLGSAHWSLPAEVVDRPLASLLVETAVLLAKDRQITEREIHLWIKHLKPVWRTNPAWMEGALKNWYADMQAHGLASPGENEMAIFIDRGLQIPPAPIDDPGPGA